MIKPRNVNLVILHTNIKQKKEETLVCPRGLAKTLNSAGQIGRVSSKKLHPMRVKEKSAQGLKRSQVASHLRSPRTLATHELEVARKAEASSMIRGGFLLSTRKGARASSV